MRKLNFTFNIDMGKIILKSLVFMVLTLFFLMRCEPYRVLNLISTNIERKISDSKSDYFILNADTIKISCYAFYSDHDSLIEFVVISILANDNDNKWMQNISYFLSDQNGYIVKTKDVRKNPNQVFLNKYIYEIVFDSELKLIIPLRFTFKQSDKEELYIDYGL